MAQFYPPERSRSFVQTTPVCPTRGLIHRRQTPPSLPDGSPICAWSVNGDLLVSSELAPKWITLVRARIIITIIIIVVVSVSRLWRRHAQTTKTHHRILPDQFETPTSLQSGPGRSQDAAGQLQPLVVSSSGDAVV